MTKVLKSHIIVLCILIQAATAGAQLSLDIGLNVSSFTGNQLRSLISDFNQSLPQDARKMKRMNIIPGITGGITYHIGPMLLLAEYNGMFSSATAKRLINIDGNKYNFVLNISGNAAGAGIGSMFGDRLSLGLFANYNWYSAYQFLSTDTKNKNRLINQQFWGIKPFIDIILSNQDYVDVSLRAFYCYPLGTINLRSLADKLDPDSSSGLTNAQLNFKPNMLGISLIFHNKR